MILLSKFFPFPSQMPSFFFLFWMHYYSFCNGNYLFNTVLYVYNIFYTPSIFNFQYCVSTICWYIYVPITMMSLLSLPFCLYLYGLFISSSIECIRCCLHMTHGKLLLDTALLHGGSTGILSHGQERSGRGGSRCCCCCCRSRHCCGCVSRVAPVGDE